MLGPLAKYRKLITSIVGMVIIGLVSHYGSANVWVETLVALATALGVYAVPNATPAGTPPGKPRP